MKELTTNEKYEIAKKAFDDILRWKQISGISYLQLGRILKDFKDKKLYESLGESPEFESFEKFLTIPAIDIKLRKAYYLIQIYTTFIEKFGFKIEELSDISWTRLRALLPCAKEENSKDLVEEAKILSHSDFDIKLKQLKYGWNTSIDCEHNEISQILFYECNSCHERFKIQPPKSKIVENK
jgi:hypothetical protein